MDEKRRAAWKAAIAKRERGEEVPPEEHCALLRDGMFGEGNRADDLAPKNWTIVNESSPAYS